MYQIVRLPVAKIVKKKINIQTLNIFFCGGGRELFYPVRMFALACVRRASVAVVALTAEAVGAQVLLPRVLREGLAARHRRHGLSGRGQHAA